MAVRRAVLPFAFALSITAACGDGGGDTSQPFVPADTAQFDGLYDVQFTGLQTAFDHTGVGIGDGEGTSLAVTLFPPGVETVTFRGTVSRGDGSVIVLESSGFESDFGFEVIAEANARQRGDQLRITGTVRESDDHPLGLFPAFRFEMRRRLGARSDRVAGGWRFAFSESPGTCQCASTVQLFLDVAADGRGSTVVTQEFDEQGRQVGVFHAGSALVSPEGQVRIQMAYGTPDEDHCGFQFIPIQPAPPCNVTLTGTLRDHEGAGTVLLREPLLGIPFGAARAWSAIQ
jgi:hypothetical protein